MLASILSLLLWLTSAQAPHPVARAVLFYSPTCGHCHHVIQEVLPPLTEKYGPQLEIIGVDVTQPQGGPLFQAALQRFNLQSSGVPFLVIGNEYLIGSVDIPEKFPALIEKYLAQGGVDWPDIPGLAEILPKATVTPAFTPTLQTTSTPPASPTPQTTLVPEPSLTPTVQAHTQKSPTPFPGLVIAKTEIPGLADKFARDPSGNGLAVVVLLGMLAVAGFAVINFPRLAGALPQIWQFWLFPILTLAGFIVAGYLAYVETSQVTAVCGPVGDCNTVQQSEYARLFGFLPIGVLGLAGYILIILAWLVGRMKRKPFSQYADLALLVMTGFGLLFSIYLTFLEPFVIGATCAWCLTSAILMTLLFLLSLKPGKLAYSNLFN